VMRVVRRTLALSRAWKPERKRRLYGVGSSALIMIEASPSAYPRGILALGHTFTHYRGGDLMRFYITQRQFYCGIDLHARSR
jgi:hypothetical protein